MTPDRIVLDTNVLISAVLTQSGTPAQVFDAICASEGTLLFSNQTRDELVTRIMRPKFDRFVTRLSRQLFVSQIDAISEVVGLTGVAMGCRDPDDDKFLETAVAGSAQLLVSGDGDLLALDPFQGIPIVTPADALRCLTQ